MLLLIIIDNLEWVTSVFLLWLSNAWREGRLTEKSFRCVCFYWSTKYCGYLQGLFDTIQKAIFTFQWNISSLGYLWSGVFRLLPRKACIKWKSAYGFSCEGYRKRGEGWGVDSKKTCGLSSSDKSGCFHFSKRDLMF